MFHELEHGNSTLMKIAGRKILTTLIEREKRERPQQAHALDRRIAAWCDEVNAANWAKPHEIKAVYGTADIVGNNRIVFDICGNRYRLIVQFNYAAQVARVRFAGTHAEYDDVDATEV